MMVFFALLHRELRLAGRQKFDVTLPLAVAVLILLLFPLSLGPEPDLLRRLAPAALWIAALLGALLGLDRLFHSDFDDGSLDQLILSGLPLPLLVLGKSLGHWLLTSLPMTAVTLLMGIFLNLPGTAFLPLALAMILGGASLTLLGTTIMALTLGARRGGALTGLLLLPLTLPIAIFGAGTVTAALSDLPTRPPLLVLGGIFLGCLAICPFLAAIALREALD